MATATQVPLRTPRTLDERGARRALLDQIARLEAQLTEQFCSTWPRTDLPLPPGRPGGAARLLSLGELEEQRDELARRAAQLRQALHERGQAEEQSRVLVEEMLLEPERYPWVRVANSDLGETGCHHWHVQPRWGLLGMLLKWWRVRISSGCP